MDEDLLTEITGDLDPESDLQRVAKINQINICSIHFSEILSESPVHLTLGFRCYHVKSKNGNRYGLNIKFI